MAREIIGSGDHVRLVREDGWEWAERTNVSGIVVIVAVTPQDELLLVEQYRRPVASRVLELPAGLAGDHAGMEDEALSTAALRELEEETGWTAGSMEQLLVGPVSAGMSNEVLTFFRAGSLRRVGPGGGDASEDIAVHAIPRSEVVGWLAKRASEGVLADPKVFAGLFYAGVSA